MWVSFCKALTNQAPAHQSCLCNSRESIRFLCFELESKCISSYHCQFDHYLTISAHLEEYIREALILSLMHPPTSTAACFLVKCKALSVHTLNVFFPYDWTIGFSNRSESYTFFFYQNQPPLSQEKDQYETIFIALLLQNAGGGYRPWFMTFFIKL